MSADLDDPNRDEEMLVTGAYLVWSNEHNSWWRSSRCGYTASQEGAGRYTRGEALSICANSRDGWNGRGTPSEIPVREDDAKMCASLYRTPVTLKEKS